MLCILPTKIKKLILVNKRTENKKVSKFWKQFCKPSFGIRTEHNNFFTTSGFPTSNTLIYMIEVNILNTTVFKVDFNASAAHINLWKNFSTIYKKNLHKFLHNSKTYPLCSVLKYLPMVPPQNSATQTNDWWGTSESRSPTQREQTTQNKQRVLLKTSLSSKA